MPVQQMGPARGQGAEGQPGVFKLVNGSPAGDERYDAMPVGSVAFPPCRCGTAVCPDATSNESPTAGNQAAVRHPEER